MTEKEQIEQRIREALATETHSLLLSHKLFKQETGLFGQLGKTLEERREIVQSPLFKQAQARLRALESQEAALRRRRVQPVESNPIHD